MEITYRTVQVYIDEMDNIIAIPTGPSKKFGGVLVGLDIINKIDSPYTDEELEEILKKTLSDCFSKEPDDSTKISSLEKYLNIKGFARAVKNKRLIILGWIYDKGYYVTPTTKVPKQGFVHLEDKTITLGKELKSGELAKAFRETIKLATS